MEWIDAYLNVLLGLPFLFLISMFLIGLGFTGSGPMSSILNVSQFTRNDPHGNPLGECFHLNNVRR